jgi:hypothetical protein
VNNYAGLLGRNQYGNQAAGNYPDNYGFGQQRANDYGRANDEYAKRQKQELEDKLKARRKRSRERGYRPSRGLR